MVASSLIDHRWLKYWDILKRSLQLQHNEFKLSIRLWTTGDYWSSVKIILKEYFHTHSLICLFPVDVTRAGEGQLEIMVNNGNLPNTVEMESAGVYKIAFVPEQAGKQYVDINFNKEPLPGLS